MSEEKRAKGIVKDYLKQVKEKLPEWMKEKKEHKDVLIELEGHIWDKAEEFSEEGTINEQSVRLAIAHLGTPKEIARQYKQRGTPKVYITEELWPYYKQALKFASVILIAIYVFFVVLNIILGRPMQAFEFFNIFTTLLAVFAIITLIFTGLSMEGYLPEDFTSSTTQEKRRKKREKALQKGLPVDPSTGEPIKPIVKREDKIPGGIIGIIFAVLFITQPFLEINALLHPEFLSLLRLAGIFMLIDSSITLTRGILGPKEITAQQITLIAMAILKFASLWLFFLFLSNPEIFTIIYWTEETGLESVLLGEQYYDAYQNIWILIMFIQVISAIYDIFKAGKFEKYKDLF